MRPERSFHVEVRSARLDRFPVVARCPEGEATGSFVIPFAANELKDLLPKLARSARASVAPPGTWRHLHLDRADRAPDLWVREKGKQLFQALVRDDVESLYRVDANRAFVLHLDPGNADFHRLANLPWEILHDPERNRYVSLCSPVVRCLHVEAPAEALPGPPLHMLVVASNPADQPPLLLSEEAGNIAGTGSGIEVHLLENPTSKELAEHARSGRYDTFHFMGHGKFDAETGRGSLVLCSPSGASDLVPADWLADILAVGGFRLAVLNACDTAQACDAEGRDPFLGVASALVAAGLPAAVAMQFPVSDEAALTFSRGFYQALHLGNPLGRAVVQGRRAIHDGDVKSLEWSTPVLYLREREEPEEGIGEPLVAELTETAVPTPWTICGLAFALQALAWTSLIWLFARLPLFFQKGLSIVDSVAVSTVLVVFVLTLSAGFFRLGSFLARISKALAWTVAALAALAGVSLWFSVFS